MVWLESKKRDHHAKLGVAVIDCRLRIALRTAAPATASGMLLAALSVLADVCDVYFNDGDMEAAVPDSRIHHSGGRDGSVEVGKADVFVSWALSMSVPNLLDALESFIEEEGRPVNTKFWVCGE